MFKDTADTSAWAENFAAAAHRSKNEVMGFLADEDALVKLPPLTQILNVVCNDILVPLMPIISTTQLNNRQQFV